MGNVEHDNDPKPMIDTLREFCKDYPLPSFDADALFAVIYDKEDIYYQIFQAIVYLYLKRAEKKKKCILLYGSPNSGKSIIAGFLEQIFLSYHMR